MSKSRAEVNDYLFNNEGEYTGISAEYVVAHAARQAQRGRNPSVAFLGHKNPIKALEAAVAVIQKDEELASQDLTLMVIASEYALYGYRGPLESMHIWGD